MLPKIIAEDEASCFKFLFNGALQDGLHYNSELYYRLKTWELRDRPRLYQLACRLASHGADVLVTTSDAQCSLWANLRNQKVATLTFSTVRPLPTVDALLQGESHPWLRPGQTPPLAMAPKEVAMG